MFIISSAGQPWAIAAMPSSAIPEDLKEEENKITTLRMLAI